MKENEKENIKMKALSDDDLKKVSGGVYGETYHAGQEYETEGVTLHYPSSCIVCGATTYTALDHEFWWRSDGTARSVICKADPGHTIQDFY